MGNIYVNYLCEVVKEEIHLKRKFTDYGHIGRSQ